MTFVCLKENDNNNDDNHGNDNDDDDSVGWKTWVFNYSEFACGSPSYEAYFVTNNAPRKRFSISDISIDVKKVLRWFNRLHLEINRASLLTARIKLGQLSSRYIGLYCQTFHENTFLVLYYK